MFSQDHFVGWALQHDEAAAPGTRISYLRVWSQSWTLCQGRQGPQYSCPPAPGSDLAPSQLFRESNSGWKVFLLLLSSLSLHFK